MARRRAGETVGLRVDPAAVFRFAPDGRAL
jgi:hypothetical protein